MWCSTSSFRWRMSVRRATRKRERGLAKSQRKRSFHCALPLASVGHSLLLFAQVITLNVSVNSDNSSLFVVLVSNNFIELKGAVFKRFDHHNLMQISASDIVERFQLTIFLIIIIVQNLAHLGLVVALEDSWLPKATYMCLMVLGGEWCVDWIKHGFITKFNNIPPIVYRHFSKVLCTDFIHTHRHKVRHMTQLMRRIECKCSASEYSR